MAREATTAGIRAAAASVLLASAGCAPQWAGPAPQGQPFGAGAGLAISNVDEAAGALDKLRELGVAWVRWDLDWDAAEKTKGVYDFSALDPHVAALHDAAIRQQAILAYGNPLYSGHADRAYPPDDPADYGRFVAAAHAHFGAQIDLYELWNEPNVSVRFFAPIADPAKFAPLVAAALDACPGCPLLLGGLNYHFTYKSPEFLAGMEAAVPGIIARIGRVAMHPYPIYPPEVAPEDDSGEEVPLTEMVARIRAAAPGMTELHLNEVGWAVYGAVDEAAQGNYLARAYLLAAEMGAASTCWFNYQDGPFHGQFPPEDDFGLLRYDGSEKPAWNALKTLIMELGALGFSARLPTPAGTHALFFRDARPSRGVTAVWRSSDDAPTSLEVKLATGKGMLVRMDGSAAEVSGDRIAVPLGDDPVLVVELAPKK